MDYIGIGFSNVRLPTSESNYVYTYDTRINTFPEEVFIHEFLHSLERTLKEYGYERPELHSYKEYGYEEQKKIGLKNWYEAYMKCNINSEKGKIGLDGTVYKLKPVHESNFKYPIEIEFNKEPSNLIEEIRVFFKSLGNIFTK